MNLFEASNFMAGDDKHSFGDKPGFDDLLSDGLGGGSSFVWDEEDVDGTDEETRPVVCFRVGPDLFAVPGTNVREIVGDIDVTPLPGAPSHIDGIIVVHRQVVGLLSLRRFLDIAFDDPSLHHDPHAGDAAADTRRTIIVETPHYTVGLCVDEVTGLDEWPESLLDPKTVPENMRSATRRYARGSRTVGGSLCVYLDVESLLDDAAVQ